MSTERYHELQSTYNTLNDEKEKIDCLIEIVLEIRNYDIDEAFRLSNEIIYMLLYYLMLGMTEFHSIG